jgi:hypothetical protein
MHKQLQKSQHLNNFLGGYKKTTTPKKGITPKKTTTLKGPVYIGIMNKESGRTDVFDANKYQISAYLAFMAGNFNFIKFEYPGNIKFMILKFNTDGLTLDYSNFCILQNEQGGKHILTSDRMKILGFVGWKNRLTMY